MAVSFLLQLQQLLRVKREHGGATVSFGRRPLNRSCVVEYDVKNRLKAGTIVLNALAARWM